MECIDTVFDRNVSQSDQGGRVFHISEIWAAADRSYGNFVTDVWYRTESLCNGILWFCENVRKDLV